MKTINKYSLNPRFLAESASPRSKTLAGRCHKRLQRGFSLTEVLIVVMVISVLASVAMTTFLNTERASRQIALEGDAKTLNRAVQSYLGSGGSLAGVTDPKLVLAKLKTKPHDADAKKIAGIQGPFVDLRLEFVSAPVSDDWSLEYDAANAVFSVKAGSSGLVTRANEALAELPVVQEDRHISLALGTKDPWVWDYAKTNVVDKGAPVRPEVGVVGPTRPTSPQPNGSASTLTPPSFSRPGGALGPNDVPAVVTLTNYNPAAHSELFYRLNGGEWTPYTAGISIPLTAVTKIESYVSPRTTDWIASSSVTATFTFQPGQLVAPVITPSTGSFGYDSFPTALTLQNTNPAGTSISQYRIGTGAWTNYTSPVSLTPDTTVVVFSRALPVDSQRWVASPEVSAMYDLVAEPLQSPVFSKAAGNYPASDYPLTVALTNPNVTGSSTIEYRQKNGTWQAYTSAITLTWNQLDVTYEARAVTTDPKKWLTSAVRQSQYILTPSKLKPPVLTPPGGYFPYATFPTSVTMVNPNNASISEIWYRFGTSGAFTKYNPASPPPLSRNNYQTTITAYIKSLRTPQFTDSNTVQELYETIYFTATTSGLFHHPVPDTSLNAMVTNLPAPAEGSFFKWGKTSGASGTSQSTMKFDGAPSATVAPGEWFFLGKLTYANGTIISGSGAKAVKLKFAFNMTQPTVATTTADYTLTLVNTANTSNAQQSADYVYLPTLGVPFATSVGGKNFKLDVRFGETTANGFGSVSEFHIYEGTSATGSMYGRITEVTP